LRSRPASRSPRLVASAAAAAFKSVSGLQPGEARLGAKGRKRGAAEVLPQDEKGDPEDAKPEPEPQRQRRDGDGGGNGGAAVAAALAAEDNKDMERVVKAAAAAGGNAGGDAWVVVKEEPATQELDDDVLAATGAQPAPVSAAAPAPATAKVQPAPPPPVAEDDFDDME